MGLPVRNGGLMALLGLFVAGCLSFSEPGKEPPVMTQAQRVQAAHNWYGWLLNPDTEMTAAPGIRKERIQVLRKEAKQWRKWHQPVARSLRKADNPRQAFYADIKTFLPKEQLLATRSRIQAGLINSSGQKAKEVLEIYALAAEHAVLAERAVRLGNGVAMGQIKGQTFLDAAADLRMFRSEFRPFLPNSLPLLENQERKTFDAAGSNLLEVVGSDKKLVDVFGVPEVCFKPAEHNLTGRDDPVQDKWQKVSPSRFPSEPAMSEKTGQTLFRLRFPLRGGVTEKSSLTLVFWEVADSFSVKANGRHLGVCMGTKAGQTQCVPIGEGSPKTPEETLDIYISLPGKRLTLPFRAVFLTRAD